MKSFIVMMFSMSMLSTGGFGQTRFISVNVKGLYSLDLPDYLEEAPDLEANASLKLRNLTRKLHVIVISEEKSKINALPVNATISDCYDYIAKQVAQKIEDAVIEKPSPEMLDTLSALQGGVNGKFLGTPLRYIIEVIESETHFYQVICWTEESALKDIGHDIYIIINSFRELKTTRL